MLNSTKCPCGRELKEVKFEKYVPMKLNDRFYGGRISMTGEMTCECGRKLVGYFERIGNNLELIDLEVTENIDDLLIEEEMQYVPKTYEEMTYKELQSVAKTKGIEKVNVKREELIEQLK